MAIGHGVVSQNNNVSCVGVLLAAPRCASEYIGVELHDMSAVGRRDLRKLETGIMIELTLTCPRTHEWRGDWEMILAHGVRGHGFDFLLFIPLQPLFHSFSNLQALCMRWVMKRQTDGFFLFFFGRHEFCSALSVVSLTQKSFTP